MAEIERRTSDLTRAEWERIAPLPPIVELHGRKPNDDRREIVNAIRYMARS